MFKKYPIIFLVLLLFILKVEFISADESVVSSSAYIKRGIKENEKDFNLKIIKLKLYFSKHASPLENYADLIVQKEEKYNLYWRLLTAIAEIDSTFGKKDTL